MKQRNQYLIMVVLVAVMAGTAFYIWDKEKDMVKEDTSTVLEFKSEDVELADQATNYINYIFNKDRF